MSEKQEHAIDLRPEQFVFLTEMAKQYNLPSEAKVVRVLIDFARHQEAQRDDIFARVRCLNC